MKIPCLGCGIKTKYQRNIFGGEHQCLIPLCKKCQPKLEIEIKKEQRRQILIKARDAKKRGCSI